MTLVLKLANNNSAIDRWESIKQNVTKMAQTYSKNKSHKKKDLLCNLYRFKNEIIIDDKIVVTNDVINEINRKILEIENERVEASVFRSKCNWAKYGERSSKYFFALEKRNYSAKTMFAVQLPSGEICREQRTIRNEQKRFYEELYTCNKNIQFNVQNESGVTITPAQRSWLEEEIIINEMDEAMNDMKLNKVPGCDGLPIEFYNRLRKVLREPLFAMFKEVVSKQEMSRSMKRGLILLLPKKNKNPLQIKSYRPLTLLSTDYKILAKICANRLKRVLPDIIGEQQTGFMEGRHIQTNIRRTMDIVAHVNRSKKRAVIISIDYEKCFDKIEHNSIFKALEYFGFGNNFIDTIKIFFKDFQVCTQNAGNLSELFHKTRGVNQGCPISPFLFNIVGEIMAHRIKNNPSIQGIKIGRSSVQHVISQFADDTNLFLMYNEDTINAAIHELMYIEQNTGLTISYEKTCIYRIGLLQYSNAQIYTIKPLKWSDGDLDILGVKIKNAPTQGNDQIDNVIEKMNNVMRTWIGRSLTLIGKTLLINSLMSSMLIYPMMVLPIVSDNQIKRINTIFETFLWKGRKPKIPLSVLQRDKFEGGLRLTDCKARHKALRMQSVHNIIGNEKWEYIYQWLVPQMGEKIWECNISTQGCERHL